MQPLLDPTYRNFSDPQTVIDLIACRSLQVKGGLELVDHTDSFVADISDDLESGTVSHDNGATIHGTVKLTISRALTWGVQRVRPYTVLTDLDAGISARWNEGVYVLTTPTQPVGSAPAEIPVTGSDKLYLLDGQVGDSYSVPAGAEVLTAVAAAITAGSGDTNIRLNSAAAGKTLPNALTWPLTSSKTYKWIDIVNQLLETVSYQNLWCDWNGAYTSGPLVDPALRGPEYAFSADDNLTTLVGPTRSYTADLWSAPNRWRFVAQNWPTTPVEGNGQYTVVNASDGPASQASVGRTINKVLYLNATDQASLQAQGDVIVAADKHVVRTVAVKLAPMPAQWHLDVASYQDSLIAGAMKVATTKWTLDLTGKADGSTTWTVVG